MPQDLIVFGEDWGRHPSSTQHLMRCLSATHRMLWINSIGLRQPKFTWRDGKRVVEKLKQWRNRAPAIIDPNQPETLSPPVWPMANDPITRTFNRTVTAQKIRSQAAASGLERPILWTSLPSAVDLVGTLNESAVVYYCGDDFGAVAGVDHKIALQKEAELAEKADLILVASPQLAAKFPANKTRLLSHGVDTELFTNPAPASLELSSTRPTAGFYGNLNEWLDQEMIGTAADALPEWDFVFVGPISTDVSALACRPNIRLLGPVPQHQLPSYSQHWTASLMPFKDCAQIRACNPLKLREYLAAGRPVIATAFPAMEAYAHVLHTVKDGIGLAEVLNALPPTHCPNDQRAAVEGESWHHRAQMLAIMLDRLSPPQLGSQSETPFETAPHALPLTH